MPPEALSDATAREMIRVWIAGDDLHVSLRPGMWADASDGDIDGPERGLRRSRTRSGTWPTVCIRATLGCRTRQPPRFVTPFLSAFATRTPTASPMAGMLIPKARQTCRRRRRAARKPTARAEALARISRLGDRDPGTTDAYDTGRSPSANRAGVGRQERDFTRMAHPTTSCDPASAFDPS